MQQRVHKTCVSVFGIFCWCAPLARSLLHATIDDSPVLSISSRHGVYYLQYFKFRDRPQDYRDSPKEYRDTQNSVSANPYSTRRAGYRRAFASLSHPREERKILRLALSLPWPALGTKYRVAERYPGGRVAERYPGGQRLSAEE
jgi:hypothetical protein